MTKRKAEKMTINREQLEKMGRAELVELRNLVETVISENAANAKREATEAVMELAQAHGFTVNDLFPKDGKQKKNKSDNRGLTPSKRMRHPEEPGLTYGGRGQHPKWLKDYVADGGKIEDLVPVEA